MSRVVVVACALAVIACKNKYDRREEAKKVTTSSTEDATKDLVDKDYRFRLRWPGDGWKVLRETDAQHLNPDAIAGLSNGKIHALVIVEHAPGAELEGLADMIVDNMQYENRQANKAPAKLAELPAVRVDLTGTLNGVGVQVRGLVVLHQDHAYQMMAYMAGGLGENRDLDRALAAFSIEPGDVRGRAMSTAVEDQVGIGWRIAAGVFESAATRLRVRPLDGWRLIVSDELHKSQPSAEVGLVHADSSAYVTIISEPVTGGDRDAYIAGRFSELLAGLIPVDEPLRAKLIGTDVKLRRAQQRGGLPVEFVLGVVVAQGRGYQFVSWYPAAKREDVESALLAMLSSIELLSVADAGELARELRREKDHQNIVAATFALRGGTYHDFENRVRWRKPAGFWKISVGQDARADNADALLRAEEVARGIYVQLIVERGQAFDRSRYHAAVDELFVEDGLNVTRRSDTQLAGVAARMTEGTRAGSGMKVRTRVTTAVVGSIALQLSVWSSAGDWPGDATVAEIAASVEVDPQMTAVETVPHLRDHRLGYAMRIPSEWERRDAAMPEGLRPISSFNLWGSRGNVVFVIALYTFEPRDDAWFLDLVEQVFRQHFGRIGKATMSEATLAGLAARHLTWEGLLAGQVDALLIKRDSTFYAVVSIDKLRTTRTYNLAREAFSLLD